MYHCVNEYIPLIYEHYLFSPLLTLQSLFVETTIPFILHILEDVRKSFYELVHIGSLRLQGTRLTLLIARRTGR